MGNLLLQNTGEAQAHTGQSGSRQCAPKGEHIQSRTGVSNSPSCSKYCPQEDEYMLGAIRVPSSPAAWIWSAEGENKGGQWLRWPQWELGKDDVEQGCAARPPRGVGTPQLTLLHSDTTEELGADQGSQTPQRCCCGHRGLQQPQHLAGSTASTPQQPGTSSTLGCPSTHPPCPGRISGVAGRARRRGSHCSAGPSG